MGKARHYDKAETYWSMVALVFRLMSLAQSRIINAILRGLKFFIRLIKFTCVSLGWYQKILGDSV